MSLRRLLRLGMLLVLLGAGLEARAANGARLDA